MNQLNKDIRLLNKVIKKGESGEVRYSDEELRNLLSLSRVEVILLSLSTIGKTVSSSSLKLPDQSITIYLQLHYYILIGTHHIHQFPT